MLKISLFSQKQDHIWLLGLEHYDTFMPDRAADTTKGATNMDFNYDPVKVYYDPLRKWDLHGANATICDTSGQILLYSNGQVIVDKNHIAIEDTINYSFDLASVLCGDWEGNNIGDATTAIPVGLLGSQKIIIAPVGNIYYFIYSTYNYCEQKGYRIAYTKVVLDKELINPQITEKDSILMRVAEGDRLTQNLYTIRHGNGRDWWLITFSGRHQEMITYLIDPYGIHETGRQDVSVFDFPETTGQISVSPDGNWLAWYVGGHFDENGGGFCVAPFDRCSGNLGTIKHKFFNVDFNSGSGVSFSQDTKYLYVCNNVEIKQYEMESNDILGSEKVVAVFDGFYQFTPGVPDTTNAIKYRVNFWAMKLGPDGRIYIFPSSASNRWLGVMQHPQAEGEACDVRQHSLKMNTNISRVLPNIAEYRLSSLDGSTCDTLGLNNHPIAKYRYEPDTIDHLRIRFTDLSYFRPETWSWDFGDGSPQVGTRHPYHTYVASGTYNVCLTVSNENSSNTSCRTITLGTSSIDDDTSTAVADITLFPNPVEDYLLVTLGEYIPQHGQILIYDISGRPVHTQRIYYGQNNVDMVQLAKGMYVWKMMDGKVEIRSGKVVKM